MIDEGDVYQRLRTVIDPELHIDIVSLGLIYDVGVKHEAGSTKKVHVTMTLTTPGCPLAPVIDNMVKEAVSQLDGVDAGDVTVEVTFDPPWNKDMMSEEARLELGIV